MRRLGPLTAPPHAASKVNVTPMIDVVMCLIIFYMLVGKLVLTTRSTVFLPEARAGVEERPQDPIVINIIPATDAHASIIIDGQAIDAAMLEPLLRERLERKPESVVQIRAGRDLPWRDIAPVIDACRALAIPDVHLAAERAR